ncbi:acetyl-CoA decarbonylase/synthase complex subunit alpha/beta [Desulfosporosinus sp. BICA1-9]|uniref:acetyl-CoA decarbonylase/synthase complex subunit alpha/beta n=1 Tax=Desulfosporosinus sp. BICA1-9 TaxID=1531958 RepID=UPI00054BEA20|nr:acetyl-CoA decarbonylase/synthase complex subunit alpha/beta [Desulfosporosinus sp. BICA1-9]KJS48143.1 MAG: bifunctional acetyl-CoA decarbonylase/synthase complex subunit alpha/beta [Peptococcaceae bacterium BRH_c23]KJS78391.1 MAG: bifunctional acetyl-CoA decarbonylase/synthase complex subunit alpha/beta [Desulfosporosinus sp. BICA1-9]HBW36556.1 CO dehydrogenase/CO-methylating acetyl-CoA synthase complex subunit beta [Desulfosporosinus sp.]
MSMEEIYADAIKDPNNQPKKLLRRVYDGTIIAMTYAEILLNRALKDFGSEQIVGYPDTAYHLPVITCLSGEKVTKLGELVPILNRMRSQIRTDLTFDNARLWGESVLYAAEVIETLNYLRGEEPKVKPWTGFLGDPIVRKHGIKMVDWTIPGVAVILGRAKDSQAAKKIVDNLMGKGFMIFLCDEIIEQLLEENVKIGEDYIAFPLGNFTQIIHAVNYAFRAGLAFGGIPAGERENHRDYQRRRIRAFVLNFGELDDVKLAASMGAIFMGFPVFTDQVLSDDMQIPDWYISEPDYEKIVPLAMEVRGIKLTNIEIPIPVNFGPAFEGETIRKAETYVEFGGGRSTAFELVQTVGPDEIVDGQVTVIGPELDSIPEGTKLPLGIKIDIYGRKMQADFEGVLERRIHYFANYGEGIWHVAQRDLCWVRISKDARAKGFLIKHLGELLLAKLKQEFPAIVDRVQVTLITDQIAVEEGLVKARERYRARDDRMRSLTDESVEDFYSCLLCQSFAPNHVCIVTPERVGLCGAVSWLDAKASYEISPNGPNQPIPKGPAIDELKGMWQSTNDYLFKASNNTLEEVNLYTLMDKPMTSCGCFEAIMAIVPEANGLMLTTREHSGMTPCGMTFSSLAGTCGGGMQTPGFMGIGRTYLLSKKFIPADGGLARIVWMPKELKEFLREDFIQRSIDEGLGADFIDKIADESVGTTVEEIVPFLEENGHPCFALESLM